MKKKNRLFVLVILLTLVAVFLVLTERKSTWNKTFTDFAVEDTASVYRVFLSDKGGNQSDLERKPNGSWTVNREYGANPDMIEVLLEGMMKLAVQKAVPRSAHNSVVSRMAAIGVKVEVYQHVPMFRLFGMKFFTRDKLAKVYYVGDATQDNRGTYMLLEGSDRPFIMYIPGFRGFLTPRYTPKEDDWRTHEIFQYRIPEIAEVSVSFPGDTLNSFSVRNNGDMTFTLTQTVTNRVVEGFDTIKVLDLLVTFTDVRFEDFLNDMPASRIDSILGSKPLHVISVIDASGDVNTVYTYPKPAPAEIITLDGRAVMYDLDRMFALINKGNDFVLIQYFTFDRLIKPLEFYLH